MLSSLDAWTAGEGGYESSLCLQSGENSVAGLPKRMLIIKILAYQLFFLFVCFKKAANLITFSGEQQPRWFRSRRLVSPVRNPSLP